MGRRSHALNPLNPAAYRAFPYLHEDMAPHLPPRSGWSAGRRFLAGELPPFGLPAILCHTLMPGVSKVNADYLVSHQARTLKDEDLATPAVRS